MKKLAVIILNWNGIKLLRQFIPAAAANTISDDADLFVADNGSTDESLSWLRQNHPEVKIIAFDKNHGFAEGYNRAIAATNYPYTILLNSDVEVPRGWWQPLLDFMEHNPTAGAAQPKIRSFADKSRFEYAGAAGGLIDRLGYPYAYGRFFDVVEQDEGQYDGQPREIAWASGAALMVRTPLYLQLGGLDPLFFAHMEEIDLCCRMWGTGYKVYAVMDSAVYHVGGASLPADNPKKTYLNFRNNLLLLHKNLPRTKGARILFLRRMADTLAWLKFVATGDFANARAILDAHRDFRSMRKQYTDFPNQDYMSKLPGADRLIVPDRFLLRKKR